jgi:hypothetical protein
LHERPNSSVDEKEVGCTHNRGAVMVHSRGYGKGKALGPDGVIMEFFLFMWPIINKKYTKMIENFIMNAAFLPRVMRGLITFLHKGGEKKQLFNWRPITLFNVMLQTRFLRRHSKCRCN